MPIQNNEYCTKNKKTVGLLEMFNCVLHYESGKYNYE